MAKSKNFLNLNSKVKTFNKSITSRRQVDGISKNEKVSDIEKPISKSASSSFRMANEMIRKESFPKKEIIKVEKEIVLKKGDKITKANSEAIIETRDVTDQPEEENGATDSNRRLFLKVAGIAGIGLAASALFPKGADAYVAGSTPTSNVVGMKNVVNARINPATEDTLGLIKANSDKFLFDVDGKLITSGTGGSANIVGVKNIADTRINPATEEGLANIGNQVNDQSIWMLRKIITLLKPLGMVTGAGSNRLSIDVNSGTIAISSGTITTVTNVTTIATLTNLANIGNVNSFSLMKDSARNAYSNSIRNNLSF